MLDGAAVCVLNLRCKTLICTMRVTDVGVQMRSEVFKHEKMVYYSTISQMPGKANRSWT